MSESEWYLFDPDDPRRAAQTMQRLRLSGRTLVVAEGTFAAWRLVERRKWALAWAARRALDARLAEARARGLTTERDAVAVFTRLSARHPELEAKINEHATRERLPVHADFLQAQGDPRGLLAALQLREGVDWLEQRNSEREWLAQHGAGVFGPFAEFNLGSLHLDWYGGWIRCVRLTGYVELAFPLAAFLRLPACACLDSLHLDADELRRPLDPSVRALYVYRAADATLDFGECARLGLLVLQGCPRQLGSIAPTPSELFVYLDDVNGLGPFLDALPTGPPERFGFALPWGSTEQQLRALLRHPALASVRELLVVWEDPKDEDAITYPMRPRWVAEVLAEVTGQVPERDSCLNVMLYDRYTETLGWRVGRSNERSEGIGAKEGRSVAELPPSGNQRAGARAGGGNGYGPAIKPEVE